MAEHGADAFAPLFAEGAEVRVIRLKAATNSEFQTVSFVEYEVDRHDDRKIAAHGGVEGNQDALDSIAKVSLRSDHSIDDGLSVFGLACLKKGSIATRLDEVALRKRPEQSWRFTLDLPAD